MECFLIMNGQEIVRELKNLIERIFVLNPQNDIIDIENLPDEFKVNKKGIISLKDEVCGKNFDSDIVNLFIEIISSEEVKNDERV